MQTVERILACTPALEGVQAYVSATRTHATGQAKTESREILASDGRPEWSWWWAISHDVARNDVSRFHHGQTCRGGGKSILDPDEDIAQRYMTQAALRRLGI